MSDNQTLVAMALLGRRLSERRLRIGLLCSNNTAPRWAVETVQVLVAAPRIEIGAAVIWGGGGAARCPAGPADALFARYRELSKPYANAFEQVTLASVLPAGLLRELPADEALRQLGALDLDVVLSLDSRLPDGSYVGLARHGLWSVVWGDPHRELLHPSFFWEVYRDSPVTHAALLEHAAGPTSARVVQRIICATVPSLFYTKNTAETPEGMKRIVVRSLYDRLVDGDAAMAPQGEELAIRHVERKPSPAGLGIFLAKRAWISAVSSRRNRRTYGQWFSVFRSTPAEFTSKRDHFSASGFQELPLRGPGYGCADPLPFRWRNRDYIFAEEILPDGRGRLVVYERDDAGGWQNPPAIILDAAHHLSHPCVFEHEGDHFMIPETYESRRVELWRAESFPHRWALDTVYAENVGAADTTPFFSDGVWYFFTSLRGPGAAAEELMLYHSPNLRGPWVAHPANPICSDVRASRMAGRLFRRGGHLIRPAQDCSGSYGRAIRLFEIERLSPIEYAEREVETIDRRWHPRSERTHTLNSTETM